MMPVFFNSLMADYVSHASLRTEEQIITGYGYPIDGAIGSSGGGRVRKLSVVCLHNKAIIARGILVTILYCGTPEARFSAIYIVNKGRQVVTLLNIIDTTYTIQSAIVNEKRQF